MKNLSLKLESIKQYFVEKILIGDFIVETCREHTITISIDKKYGFVFWGQDKGQYTGTGDYFMDLQLTQEESKKCFDILRPHHTSFLTEVLAQKIEELENLKKKLS